MQRPRLSYEEFKFLFESEFRLEEELKKEYETYGSLFEQLDQIPVPDLSSNDKAEIFENIWRDHTQNSCQFSWFSKIYTFLTQPFVTFALGLCIGCFLTVSNLNGRVTTDSNTAPAPALSMERTGDMQIISGKIINEIYPQVENPKIVLEKKKEASSPQRVLYGTLDHGEVYFVCNL